MIKVIFNIIIGGLFVWLGFYAFVLKTDGILSFFGTIPFFDKHFGADGGSRLGYKLIGVLIIFLGFLIMFGLIDNFILWMFSPLTKYNNTPALQGPPSPVLE